MILNNFTSGGVMQNKSTFLIIILFALSIIFPLETLPQRKPDERIKDRLPDRNEVERPVKQGNPKIKNPPPPKKEITNPPHHNPIPPQYHPEPPICYEPPPPRPNHNPTFPEIIIIDYKLSGIEKFKDGDFKTAIEYLTSASIDSNDYEIFYYKGMSEIKLQLFEDALEDLDYYLEFIIYEPDGYFQRGLAKFYLSNKSKAKLDFIIAADMGHKQAVSILKRFY